MQKDAIYREAALEALETCLDTESLTDEVNGGDWINYDEAVGLIEELPSAEPERKTGRWLKISPAGIYECSECGKNSLTADISEYRFCHGCGADMRGTEEGGTDATD